MDEYESLSHTTWTCKYHVVFIPKCRRKALYQELRRHLGEVFRKLAYRRNRRSRKGIDGRPRPHAAIDPAETRVSQVVGYIKGKSAIHLARVYGERKRNLWASTFGPVGSS
jgi:putative transposase